MMEQEAWRSFRVLASMWLDGPFATAWRAARFDIYSEAYQLRAAAVAVAEPTEGAV
jgi:hypothetical protein